MPGGNLAHPGQERASAHLVVRIRMIAVDQRPIQVVSEVLLSLLGQMRHGLNAGALADRQLQGFEMNS